MSTTVSAVIELAGAVVDGRYRVLHRIGSGGMGEVWVAHDHNTEREVALKIIKREHNKDPELVVRFRREARAVTKVSHEIVVTVYDAGTCEVTGIDYIAMELLSGASLGDHMARGAMTSEIACAFARDVVAGLAAAHEAGIVHRDVKPDNVIVVDGAVRARAKLLDFGIARRFDPGDTMTMPGTFMGTPGYAAPEVTLGEATHDPKSDLYAAGVIWWEMLTGHPLFKAPTPVAVLLMHAQDPPRKPSVLASVPVAVENMILRLLDKNPKRRPDAKAVLAFLDARARPAKATP